MFKNITLSGKKKLVATLFGVFSIAGTASLVAINPAYIGVAALITFVVNKYINAETELDKQRAATTLLNSLVYAAKDFKFTTPGAILQSALDALKGITFTAPPDSIVGADNQFKIERTPQTVPTTISPLGNAFEGTSFGTVLTGLLKDAGISADKNPFK